MIATLALTKFVDTMKPYNYQHHIKYYIKLQIKQNAYSTLSNKSTFTLINDDIYNYQNLSIFINTDKHKMQNSHCPRKKA